MGEQDMQLQIVQLVQAAMGGDELASQLILQIMQAAQQGDQQATQVAQMIQAVVQQLQGQQTQMAKRGAKINYLSMLRGKCPQGTRLEYFEVGGKICKKCVQNQKLQRGGQMPEDPIEAFKCGRKMRKSRG